MSRTRVAALCAVLSTAAVAAMSAMIVLVGGGPCDVRGCDPGAVLSVSATAGVAARGPVPPSARCPGAAPVSTPPPTAQPPSGDACAAPAASPPGGMVTGRVPAP